MVEFTKRAIADLKAIRQQIALDSPARAVRIASEIAAKCEFLDQHPMIGRPGVEPGTRELSTAHPWIIVYEIVDNTVTVLRLWHNRQGRR